VDRPGGSRATGTISQFTGSAIQAFCSGLSLLWGFALSENSFSILQKAERLTRKMRIFREVPNHQLILIFFHKDFPDTGKSGLP